MWQTNPGCRSCDYVNECSKKIVVKTVSGEQKLEAKKQMKYLTNCENRVQEICLDCPLFKAKKCASWKKVNGKVLNPHTLSRCPLKERSQKEN